MNTQYLQFKDLIKEVDIRNTSGSISDLWGVSIDKKFIRSVANIIGTDLTKYKVVKQNQFVCSLMRVSRDEKIPIDRWNGEAEIIVSPAYKVFEVKDDNIVLPEYLNLWFRRSEFDREASYYGVGGVRGSLEWEDFCEMALPVPLLAEQQEIVDAYNDIERRIALKRKINDNLEAQLTVFYHQFFDKDKDNICTIGDFGEIVGGATPSTENPKYFCKQGISWLSPKDLTATGFKFIYKGETDITEEGYRSCSTKLLPIGSVLLTSRAPVGTVAIAMNELCTNQGFKSIIPRKEIGTEFVYYFLKENKQLLDNYSSGTTFMEISGNVLKNIPAFYPNEISASNFRNVCKKVFEEQILIEKELRELNAAKTILTTQLSRR